MIITSLNFVFFTLLVLLVYYQFDQRWQNAWLLLVSYIFVFTWDWRFAFLLGAVTAVNFVIALRLKVNGENRRNLLWLGIGLNVFVLIFFRAYNFFLPEMKILLERLGISIQANGLDLLIPLGLSFYTLQTISYLIDVYRGQLSAEKNLVNFSLYLAYFPKIVAGPIERARSFLPKLVRSRTVDGSMISRSLSLIFLGMGRKLLIADTLSAWILPDVFEIPAKYNPPELAAWLIIYSFAIYNDFAGYTEMARGVSGLFGIELSVNFRTPYFSRSFTEFWTRWHISLSEWLRDYIYFPVSRALSRRNPDRRAMVNLVVPPMLTMLVSGIWHGFGIHMVIWGSIHGMYLTLERIPSIWRPTIPPQNQPAWKQGLAMASVFMLVILAWVPFRWGVPVAFDFWNSMLRGSDFSIGYSRIFWALPILLGSLFIDYLQYHTQDEFVYLKWPRWVRAVCMAMIMMLVFLVTGGDFKEPFVYQAC
jgi:D-alanyl-lipoteichoic acid acyltransferase DltB (MBOAT superfamily)